MKRIISILTATRAEYGLLRPLIARLNALERFDVRIVATGAHLSPEFGLTYQEIERDGYVIDEKIEMLLSSDTPAAISKSMGIALIGFADYFRKLKPDLLVVLGDRYETLAVAIAAMNERIPIAHLYGGETTEGAVDEAIRHAITKLSYLHFTSTESYRNRVIQLGENPERVFNVGALGIENIKSEPLLRKEELQQRINVDISIPYAVATFHPVTLDNMSAEEQIEELLNACIHYQNLRFIFSKANADANGRIINAKLEQYSNTYDNIYLFSSLGVVQYLSALKYCAFVIGNSSSGIIEAPSFSIPTINIGDRQKGRIKAASIVDCQAKRQDIISAIHLALEESFRQKCKYTVNPYGDGNTAEKIVDIIKKRFDEKQFAINIKKSFFDLKPV